LLKFLRKEFAGAGLFGKLYKACGRRLLLLRHAKPSGKLKKEDCCCYVMPSPVESLASKIVALIIWQVLVES